MASLVSFTPLQIGHTSRPQDIYHGRQQKANSGVHSPMENATYQGMKTATTKNSSANCGVGRVNGTALLAVVAILLAVLVAILIAALVAISLVVANNTELPLQSNHTLQTWMEEYIENEIDRRLSPMREFNHSLESLRQSLSQQVTGFQYDITEVTDLITQLNDSKTQLQNKLSFSEARVNELLKDLNHSQEQARELNITVQILTNKFNLMNQDNTRLNGRVDEHEQAINDTHQFQLSLSENQTTLESKLNSHLRSVETRLTQEVISLEATINQTELNIKADIETLRSETNNHVSMLKLAVNTTRETLLDKIDTLRENTKTKQTAILITITEVSSNLSRSIDANSQEISSLADKTSQNHTHLEMVVSDNHLLVTNQLATVQTNLTQGIEQISRTLEGVEGSILEERSIREQDVQRLETAQRNLDLSLKQTAKELWDLKRRVDDYHSDAATLAGSGSLIWLIAIILTSALTSN